MKNGRLQAKDIPADLVLAAIRATPGYWRTWSAVLERFDELMPGVPHMVFVRKVGAMHPQVHACVHTGRGQCRGDVHLAEECNGC